MTDHTASAVLVATRELDCRSWDEEAGNSTHVPIRLEAGTKVEVLEPAWFDARAVETGMAYWSLKVLTGPHAGERVLYRAPEGDLVWFRAVEEAPSNCSS